MVSRSPVIEELYRVFSPYRVGDEISGCSHCVPADQSHFLATTPRAELSADDLDKYAFKAMTTWGNEADFKYFLPRLLELVLTEGINAFNFPEVLFGKLEYARWFDWPTAERRAIESYLRAFWRAQIECEPTEQEGFAIDSALCALANACRSVDEYLTTWTQSKSPNAVRQLAQFVWFHADRILTKNHPFIGHWDGRPATSEVLAWIKSDDAVSFLQQGSVFLTGHLTYVPEQLAAIRSDAVELPCSGP